MADNAPFYVGSTEDHDILIHPDNAVSLQPKGFAEKNGITAHPDGAIALRNVAPKLYKSLGPGFQGTERDISIVQSEQPPSLSLRAGNAVRDAADAASRGLGKIVDYVRGTPQTEPTQAAQPPPPPAVPQQPVKRAPQPVPPGVNPQNWDTEEGRMIGSPGATHLQMGDGTEVILPEGYEDTGRLIGQPGATHLQMGDGKEVILPAGYENTGGGGGGAGGASGKGSGGAPGEESLWDKAKGYLPSVRLRTENLPQVRLKTENLPSVRLTPQGRELYEAGKKAVLDTVRPLDLVDPLRVRDVVAPPPYNDKYEGGGGAGGASGSGTGGAPGEELNRYPNIAVGTPYERGVASAPQGSYFDLAHPPRSSSGGSGGSGGSSGGNSGGITSGGGAETGAARGAEDVAAMRRAMSEGSPNGLTFTTEDSEASLGNSADPLQGVSAASPEVQRVVDASNGVSPFASAYTNTSGKPSPEAPVVEKAKPQLIGTTPKGEEVILTADNTPLVMQKGTAAAYGYSAHPDAPAIAEKLGPRLRSQVMPVGQPQVLVTQTSEPGSASLRARNAVVDAADAAEKGLSNIGAAIVPPKPQPYTGGPRTATVTQTSEPGSASLRAGNAIRDAADAAQKGVEGAAGNAGRALFNSLFPTLGALSNAVGIGQTVGGVNSGAAQAAITGATEAERVGAFASAKRLAGLDLTPDEVAKADAFEKNPVQGLREAMDRAVKDGLSVAQSKIGKSLTPPAEQAPGTTPGQKVKPVIPVGAAQVPGATPPGAVPAPGQSGASVSSARMFVPGVKGDAAPTSETKAQEVERRGKGMADREEQIAQMQSKADQDLANTKERQSQEIARLDAQEMEIRRKANEDAEKMLGDLKAKADEIYNTKTDPYRAFRHTDTGQKIALVAGAFLNGFANAVNPGRNGKDAFEQIMDNDIQAQAKDIKNKESGLNQLMDVFKNHGTLTQNKILAATMLKSKYLEEAARTVEVMGLRSGDPIKVEMAKNKADSLRNQAVALGQAAQEEALKITHGNQQTQLNYQAIQKNKMDLDLQQTMLQQMQNGGAMAGWPSREFYGHTVVIPPSVARDPKELNKLYDSAQRIFAAHNATRTVADQALKYLADNKNWGTNGPNTALELKKMASRVAEVQRQNLGQTSVPTSELFGVIEEVLGKGNGFTPGNFDRVVRAWQDVAQQSDLDADSFFTVNRMGKLSTLRATRKDLQYGNTPTAAPAPGN